MEITVDVIIRALIVLIGYVGLVMVVYGWDAQNKIEQLVEDICEIEHSANERTACDQSDYIGISFISMGLEKETFCCFRHTVETNFYMRPLFGLFQFVFGSFVFVLSLFAMVVWIKTESKLRTIVISVISFLIITMTFCREVLINEYKTKLAGIHNTISSYDTLTSGNELLEGLNRSLLFSRTELGLALVLLVVTVAEYFLQKKRPYDWERNTELGTIKQTNEEANKQPLIENDNSYLPPRSDQAYDEGSKQPHIENDSSYLPPRTQQLYDPVYDRNLNNRVDDQMSVSKSNSFEALNALDQPPSPTISTTENTYESPPSEVNEYSLPADSTYDQVPAN